MLKGSFSPSIKFEDEENYLQRSYKPNSNNNQPFTELTTSRNVNRPQLSPQDKQKCNGFWNDYAAKLRNKNVDLTGVVSDVAIFGELRQVSVWDLLKVPDLVNTDSSLKVKEIGNLIYDDRSLRMLNVFLYYCIKVSNNVNLDGIELYYQKLLRDTYVQLGMKVDIAHYSQICSKVLSLGRKECAHIIYYLVYGRLATDCFVDAITDNRVYETIRVSPKGHRKVNRNPTGVSQIPMKKAKSSKSSEAITQRKGSRSNTYTNQWRNKQAHREQCHQSALQPKSQVQTLAEDLSKIFVPSLTAMKDKHNRQGSLDCREKPERGNWGWQGSSTEKKYYMTYYPNKISNDEKSAFMESFFPSAKTSYKFMRRRKFDYSAVERMMEKVYPEPDEASMQENKDRSHETEKKDKRFIMNCNISKVNDLFKNEGSELDKIRTNLKEKGNMPKKRAYIRSYLHTDNEYLYNNMRKQKADRETELKKGQSAYLEELKEGYEEENQFVNLTRKMYSKNNSGGKRNMESQDFNSNQRGSPSCDEKAHNRSGSKTRAKFLSPCRSRLYEYKTEYRRFLKRHAFNQ